MKQNIAILGSTGSIGLTSLRVIDAHSERYNVYALIAGVNVSVMFEQALKYKPAYIVMATAEAQAALVEKLKAYFGAYPKQVFECEILSGEKSMCEVVSLDTVHQVIAAIVGGAGLVPTMAAVKAGKRILLANKEALVMCGDLFMQAVKSYHATLLPIDSEHNAIFQALPEALQNPLGQSSLKAAGIHSVVLTGSGGPFLHRSLETFDKITVEEAIAHPRWKMGSKISVDSATMMNKGLEYIEARWLFNASEAEVEIVLHPESIIHSMVRYEDGSVLAQMGVADMAIPISHALAYPQRVHSPAKALDFFNLSPLTFMDAKEERYPCLYLAKMASRQGQVWTTILNAANEIAVAAFLDKRILFTHIYQVNHEMLNSLDFADPHSIDDLLAIDAQVRVKTAEFISKKVSF